MSTSKQVSEQTNYEDPGTFDRESANCNSRPLDSLTVLLAGVGNVGSQLALQLAPVVGTLRIIDRDVVARKNALNQAYDSPDSRDGMPGGASATEGKLAATDIFQGSSHAKVDDLAPRLRARNPRLQVESFAEDLQDVPWGWFRDADVILGALDSLAARQTLGTHAYRFGVPYIDGGVGEPWLGRVQVFRPQGACIQCGWGKQHYRQLATEHPCRADRDQRVASTSAVSPAFLGAITAGLMSAELFRIFGVHPAPVRTRDTRDASPMPQAPLLQQSYEVSIDVHHSQVLRSRLKPASRCRFPHETFASPLRFGDTWPDVTVQSVIDCLDRHYGPHQPLCLETRRGRRLAPNSENNQQGQVPALFGDRERFTSRDELRHWGSHRLTDWGFTVRDEILVRPKQGPQAPAFVTWTGR